MNPAWNRLVLTGALALAITGPARTADAAEPASALPPLKVLDGMQDGMWWHIRKVSPEQPGQRNGSESGCVAIADYVQATINLQRPADMQCPVEVIRDRTGSAELRVQCVPMPVAGPDAVPAEASAAAPVRYTLRRSGSDEIELLAEQGEYRYSSRFLRIGECGA